MVLWYLPLLSGSDSTSIAPECQSHSQKQKGNCSQEPTSESAHTKKEIAKPFSKMVI